MSSNQIFDLALMGPHFRSALLNCTINGSLKADGREGVRRKCGWGKVVEVGGDGGKGEKET